jgi:hypothetical protein
MIKRLTRGSVLFEFEGKSVTLQGEGLLRGYGSPDWVIYENSLLRWEAPHQEEALDDDTRRRLLSALIDAFRERGMNAVIE